MDYRKFQLESGTKILLGKDETSNDKLMKEFKGRPNTILHTSEPGSPFGVINKISPDKEEIYEAGIFVVKFSQSWRDNKQDIKIDVFTGKDISKPRGMNPGTWKVKNKKTIKVKKKDIIRLEKSFQEKEK